MQEIVNKKKPRTMAKRIEILEAEIADLKQVVEQLKSNPAGEKVPSKHDWQKTFGIFKDDPTHEEAVRLGQAWRRRQPKC